MQTVGCSTTSASPTQLRKGGAKFLARIKSNGHDAEKRRSSLVLGAIMRCGSLAFVCGQHGGAVRIVTSSTARTSLAFSYHYILIPSSYHHIHQQNLPLLVPSILSNRISIGFRDRRPCLTLFGRTPLSCFPPLRSRPAQPPGFMHSSSGVPLFCTNPRYLSTAHVLKYSADILHRYPVHCI
jgi:hypothetical protein